MSDDGGFSSFFRNTNAAYLIFFLGLLIILFGLYVFRPRLINIDDLSPSLDRVQKIAIVLAMVLILVSIAAALWEAVSSALKDENWTLGSVLSSITRVDVAYLIFALAFGVIVLGLYFLIDRTVSIANLFSTEATSFASLRSYALSISVLLIVAVLVGTIVRYVWPGVTRNEFASIAPFTISGVEDKQRGLALATAFQAKLAELQRDTEVLDEILQKSAEDESDAAPQDRSESSSLNIYRKLEFELKFQGVDVGGLLNWAVNTTAMRRAMQITVAEQDGKAIVSGALRPDGTSQVYATVTGGNERIVAAVAYSKLRERLVEQQPEFQALDWDDIELLHHTIMSVTRLRARSQVTRQDFAPHYDAIIKLIAKAPRLERLLTFGAEIAMKAGKIDSALAYLDRTNEYLDLKRDELDRQRSRSQQGSADDTDELTREFIGKYNAQVILRQRIISSCALQYVENLQSGTQPETVFANAFAAHKALLRVEAVEKKRDVKVAILAGVPERDSIAYQYTSLGDRIPGKYGLDAYADTIGLIVKTLSPNSSVIFVPLGQYSRARRLALYPDENEIAAAVEKAVKGGANVVLIPFAAVSGNARKTRIETIEKFSGSTIIVSPAIATSTQKSMKIDISSMPAVFAASVDVDGRSKGATLSLSEQPLSYKGALWAPGTRIPRLTADGIWQTTYGNHFAAVTAAAVAANVFSALDSAGPADVVNLLRHTVRHIGQEDANVGVLDQTAALQKLAQKEVSPAYSAGICGAK